MYNYYFNKDTFNFTLSSDGSNIEAYQITDFSDIWSIEIFPPNQTKSSFECAEFSGKLYPLTGDYNIYSYPTTWEENKEIKEEFINTLKEEIKNITLIKKEEV